MNVRSLADSVSGVIDRAVNEDVVRLAVTGLSRAGKTVFITSLIQNLLALGNQRDVLPELHKRLSRQGVNRLRAVAIEPAGSSAVPRFDFAAKLAGLSAGEPVWPGRTTDIARIALSLTLDRPWLKQRSLGSRRVRLEIVDYPGEWLLDLPLLKQSYAAWSAQTLALLRQAPRAEASERFLAFVSRLRPGDRLNEDISRQGHRLYKAALEACQIRFGLRYLQPGRFLCPGPLGDVPLLWFFPMDVHPPLVPPRNSLMALLDERFEAYKRDIRASFFDTHFRFFDRQVVLVDVLGALYAGQAAFEDTARALADIAGQLRYGAKGWLPGASRIGRVVFAATKADHVPAAQRDALRHLLRFLAGAAEERQRADGAAISYQTVAALRSTRDAVSRMDGRPVEVVEGRLVGEDKVRPFYVGTVPLGMPPAAFWEEGFFELPRFRPPPVDPSGQDGLPHIGLDTVLDDLLGDLL